MYHGSTMIDPILDSSTWNIQVDPGTSRTTQVDPGRPRRIRYMQAHSTPHKQSFFPSSYFPLSFRFTSIGNRSNTEPNPALSYYDPVTSEVKFMPAYALTNGDEERRGRL